VLTLHGFAAEFARDLRERGIEAWALSEENQMELRLQNDAVEAAVLGGKSARHPPRTADTTESEFAAFAKVGEAIGATPAKLEKIRLLADYLRLLNADQLPLAATYFTGRAFAQSDLRTLQVGTSIVYRAIMSAAN